MAQIGVKNVMPRFVCDYFITSWAKWRCRRYKHDNFVTGGGSSGTDLCVTPCPDYIRRNAKISRTRSKPGAWQIRVPLILDNGRAWCIRVHGSGVLGRHGPDFHLPQSQVTIDSPDFHPRRSQKCLLG